MSERIKELHLKAGLWASDQLPFTNPEWVELRDKKFAELIVKECFEVVIKDHRFNDCKGIIQGAAAVAKEHFGVEE